MAHLVENMAYTGEAPWHGLGVKVPGNLTPGEMLRLAGLDWTVSKRTLLFFTGRGEDQKMLAERCVLVRDTDCMELSIVPKNWEPIQNHEAFDIFAEFVEKGHMTMETAGSLRNGKVVWALARTREEFRIFGDDTIKGYFLFSNPHQYGQPAVFGGTSVRVVCNNTHSFAMEQGLSNEVKFGHRRVFDVERAKEAVSELHVRLDRFSESAQVLGRRKYTDEELKKYFSEVFPYTGQRDDDDDRIVLSRRAKEAMRAVEIQPGTEYAPRSWWQAYNAISYMTDHYMGNTRDGRLNSAWFGYGKRLKEKAWNLAFEYAKAA